MPLPPESSSPASTPDHAALADALRAVLLPLVDMALARGLSYQVVEELLRRTFVESARRSAPAGLPHRQVSRISTATGLNRREVARLMQADDVQPPRRSPAAEIFARWRNDPALRQADGRPRPLPRTGEAASFEALARSITQDVHPRSQLDELLRLGLAEHDASTDTVTLVREAFVSARDTERLGFLADNVGDHLRTAVDNVLGDGSQHLEQAVFADELSTESIARLRPVLRAQWHSLAQTLVPLLQQLIDEDRTHQRPQDQRVRIGLYSYHAAMPLPEPNAPSEAASAEAAPPTPATPAVRARKNTRRT